MVYQLGVILRAWDVEYGVAYYVCPKRVLTARSITEDR